MTFIPHVIDGQESESAYGVRFASVDPWTREPYAEVAPRVFHRAQGRGQAGLSGPARAR
jgi:hypothetical protein